MFAFFRIGNWTGGESKVYGCLVVLRSEIPESGSMGVKTMAWLVCLGSSLPSPSPIFVNIFLNFFPWLLFLLMTLFILIRCFFNC